ncbi:MAG: endolytic transglycosylase MltG [Saprospiraceae bacterium]|nr:endolytic transglycosylase MltG [Saprospiraceae bacterium]
MVKSRKIAIFSAIALLCIAGITGIIYVKPVFEPAVKESLDSTYVLFVASGSGFEDVFQTLQNDGILKNPGSFKKVSRLMGYVKDEVPAGRFEIKSDMSTKNLISKLRSGNQDAVNVVINNVRTIADLCGKLDNYFEIDSLTLYEYIISPAVLKEYQLSADNIMTLFIPNTYQMFWTTKPEKLLQRMKREHDIFWNQEKLNKIKKLGLSPSEAYTLASIVEKESNYAPERPAIAGVYLNRIKTGMKLQADPTVVFATGEYELKRVLYSHLTFDSPFNTYMYEGIPPGPIYMPSISSLNAVVTPENHDYIFFCAKPDDTGQHVFASTLDEHDQNAKKFSSWLNARGIK